jgi:hypothetical protein
MVRKELGACENKSGGINVTQSSNLNNSRATNKKPHDSEHHTAWLIALWRNKDTMQY